MSCDNGCCGTGGYTGPKPGDPDNTSILTATPAFGGIDVAFTYPGINPHAVAHTLLYRGILPTFDGAILHKVMAGNFFYDRITDPTPIRYYYWIQIVSVNGTVGDLIGPASAIARPTIESMIELLTGKIDKGVLAQALKSDIARIDTLEEGLTQEAAYRVQDSQAIATAFQGLQATMDATSAAVLWELTARADADSALAQQITTTQAALGDNIASVQTEMRASVGQLGGKLTEIGALYTAKLSVNGLIGGFGVYNDGTEVEAGFDVDRFWVGRTNANKRKPFIIENDETFINEAVINKLTFNKLRDESGSLIVEGGRVKAQYLRVGTASIDDAAITNAKIGGSLYSKNWLYGQSGWLLDVNGNLYANSGEFRGNLVGANGTFSGTLTASAVNAVNTINIAGNAVTVSNSYVYPPRAVHWLGDGYYGGPYNPYVSFDFYLPVSAVVQLYAFFQQLGGTAPAGSMWIRIDGQPRNVALPGGFAVLSAGWHHVDVTGSNGTWSYEHDLTVESRFLVYSSYR